MKTDDHHTLVERWLADAAEDEAAVRDVVRLVTAPDPPSGFAERVLAAAIRDGLAPVPARRGRMRTTARLLAWCGMVLVAVAATAVMLGPLLVRQVVRLLNFSVQGFVWIVGGLAGGLDAWSLMVEIGRAIGASLTTPQVSGGIVVIELVGVAALYALHRLLSGNRESQE